MIDNITNHIFAFPFISNIFKFSYDKLFIGIFVRRDLIAIKIVHPNVKVLMIMARKLIYAEQPQTKTFKLGNYNFRKPLQL